MKKPKHHLLNDQCLCCEHPLHHNDRYCPHCGQKNTIKRLSIHDFLKEFVSNFYSLDSKIIVTIRSLFTRPGKAALEFIRGKRAYYANPFRFYLSVSVVYFLVLGLMGKLDNLSVANIDSTLNVEKKANLGAVNDSLETLRFFRAEVIQDSSFFNRTSLQIETFISLLKTHQGKPMSVQKSLDSLGYDDGKWNLYLFSRAKIIHDMGENPVNRNLFLDYIKGNLPLIIFITLPMMGLVFWLIYVRSGLTYAEHLVLVFNLNAYLFIWLLLLAVLKWLTSLPLDFIIYIIFPLYMFLALRRFYGQGFGRTLLKLFLLTLGIGIQSVLGAIFIFSIVFLLY